MDPIGAPPKRIGVLGGTFDPIHVGHLIAASEAAHAFELGRVLFVPAARPWQKSSYSDPEDRFMMTMLAIEGHGHFAASRIELDRRGPTYTADTMMQLRDFYGEDTSLYFIAGADAIANVGTWEKLDALRDLAEFIAVTRGGVATPELPDDARLPHIHDLTIPGVDISATDIRRRVAAGLPIDFLVPERVASYIRSHGLYQDTHAREAS
ncbi:MAG: nicotinate-nucleotide adenylyltransferase [Actinomycetota bacterium]